MLSRLFAGRPRRSLHELMSCASEVSSFHVACSEFTMPRTHCGARWCQQAETRLAGKLSAARKTVVSSSCLRVREEASGTGRHSAKAGGLSSRVPDAVKAAPVLSAKARKRQAKIVRPSFVQPCLKAHWAACVCFVQWQQPHVTGLSVIQCRIVQCCQSLVQVWFAHVFTAFIALNVHALRAAQARSAMEQERQKQRQCKAACVDDDEAPAQPGPEPSAAGTARGQARGGDGSGAGAAAAARWRLREGASAASEGLHEFTDAAGAAAQEAAADCGGEAVQAGEAQAEGDGGAADGEAAAVAGGFAAKRGWACTTAPGASAGRSEAAPAAAGPSGRTAEAQPARQQGAAQGSWSAAGRRPGHVALFLCASVASRLTFAEQCLRTPTLMCMRGSTCMLGGPAELIRGVWFTGGAQAGASGGATGSGAGSADVPTLEACIASFFAPEAIAWVCPAETAARKAAAGSGRGRASRRRSVSFSGALPTGCALTPAQLIWLQFARHVALQSRVKQEWCCWLIGVSQPRCKAAWRYRQVCC